MSPINLSLLGKGLCLIRSSDKYMFLRVFLITFDKTSIYAFWKAFSLPFASSLSSN